MNQNEVLFELCIAYSKDSESLTQAQYIRDKLGECKGSMQVEFSKFVQATKPEWQEMAEKFRDTGKPPLLARGSYKEAVFKKAVMLWDHENEMDTEDEGPAAEEQEVARKARGTKRKSASRPKPTRASRNTRGTKNNAKVIEERPSPSPPNAKRRRTRLSTGKKKAKNAGTGANDSPNFEVMENSLDLLTGGLHQIQLHHNSMKYALAEAREANKELKKEKLALEVELEHVSESLEEESESLGQLKVENKKLRQEIAKCANGTDALARKRAANKKLKQENNALKIALETAKEDHNQELSTQAKHLDDQRETNRKLQQQIVGLRSELEQLGKIHCRTTESISVQTKLLQEQCKTLVSPGAASCEWKSPTADDDIRSKLNDKASIRARRISL
mmetsp:Transcript_16552/g.40468  ORF Transcript_16552/g.40468 Transcript_16552/m.40468 type:complete len:390 (+) Transcript_16552:547-1716(+)